MGALVSFELVRLLRKQYDTKSVHLFVSVGRAPQIPVPDPPIHALLEPAFKEELRRLNGTLETVLEKYFEDVSSQVWNFCLVGYQVCQTWLNERQGCSVSEQDIQQYQRIVTLLKEITELIVEIDAAIQLGQN